MDINTARAWFAGILADAEMKGEIGSPLLIPSAHYPYLIAAGREYFKLIEAEDRRREAASRGGKASPSEVKKRAAKRGESKAREARQQPAADKLGISLRAYRARPAVQKRRERYVKMMQRKAELEAEAAALRAAHDEE